MSPSDDMLTSLRDQLQASLGSNFTLERELGGGGMAYVFLARDVALRRSVVVKVLPPEAAGAISAERFQREIALAARLQHPHIVPVLSAGATADGLPFYTMPFVDGSSLRERLVREGELGIGDAVRVLRDVARALSYAHEHGIVHRDIKPDNVMLSGSSAMVTDFGVAKALAVARSDEPDTNRAQTLTQVGTSLGTPAYMSPEQALGESAVDSRADLYAFGCMAYEMLTGHTPFTGRSTHALLAAHVVEKPVPVDAQRRSVPPALAALVMQCLEKRPADRPKNADEISRVLDAPFGAGAASVVSSSAIVADAARGDSRTAESLGLRVRRWSPWLIAAAAIVVAMVTRLNRSGDTSVAASHAERFVIAGLADDALNGGATITPDGSAIVYVEADDPARRLKVRRLSELAPRALAGTEGAVAPFVSADGHWVGFFSGNRLKKVPLDGRLPPTTLATTRPLARGAWMANGDAIVMSGSEDGGLTWVPSDGGAMRAFTVLDRKARETVHDNPLPILGGAHILFTIDDSLGQELAIADVDRGSSRPAAHTRLGITGLPVAVRDGWLVARGTRGTLEAVRFDARRHKVMSTPVPVLEDSAGVMGPMLANDGTLLYSHFQGTGSVVIVDAHGVARPFVDEARGGAGDSAVQFVAAVGTRHFMNPRISPDGRRVALMSIVPRGQTVWAYDLNSRTPTRLTTTERVFGSEWAPTGNRILYSTNNGGESALWVQSVEGAGSARKLFETAGLVWGTMTPDGKTVVFQRTVNKAWGLWTMPIDSAGGAGSARPLFSEPFNSYMPHISPDGHWIVYVSSGGDREEVYVRPFPGPGLPVQISEVGGGGTEPMWAPDGRRVFYRSGRALIAASVRTTPNFTVTARTTLFTGSFDGGMPHANYAVLPDGEHFVMVAKGSAAPEGVAVLHWDAELRAALAKP